MNLKELCAVLTVYSHNFHVLHWGATGHRFDDIHRLADQYYKMITDDIDVVAEQGLRLGQNPGGYSENLAILEHCKSSFLCLDYEDVNYEEFCRYTAAMLEHILMCIANVLKSDIIADEIANVGIKSTLEAMYEKYDLQMRYLNKRRSEDA